MILTDLFDSNLHHRPSPRKIIVRARDGGWSRLPFLEECIMKIINVTPHVLNFRNQDGSEFEVAPSGVVLSATPADTEVGVHPSGAQLVKVRFVGGDEANSQLSLLEAANPGALIVGSMIAAQGFPGRVVAVIAAPGFERRPPAEKRMRADRFTVFPE